MNDGLFHCLFEFIKLFFDKVLLGKVESCADLTFYVDWCDNLIKYCCIFNKATGNEQW